MSSWVNRTVLSGSSTAANGTSSHTCTFTAATSGNCLVAIVGGAVTFSTPTGWSLITSAINNCGLYAFTKTAGAGESSFTTTHNGSNYAIEGIVYEFAAGSALVGTAGSVTTLTTSSAVPGPACTGLSGTYTRFAARTQVVTTSGNTPSTVWTLPTTSDYDAYVAATATDGVSLTIAYDDGATGTSFTPSANTTTSIGTTLEGISFAVSVVSLSAIGLPWLRFN